MKPKFQCSNVAKFHLSTMETFDGKRDTKKKFKKLI